MQTLSEDNIKNQKIQQKYTLKGRRIFIEERYQKENDVEEKLLLLQENYCEGNIAVNSVKG